MKRIIGKLGRPGTVLAAIALVVALTGSAVAASNLKLGQFDKSSRDRLAGTGVIQYAAQQYVLVDDDGVNLQTFVVNCERKKKAAAGGYKIISPTPGVHSDWIPKDAYPTGGGYVVRGWYDPFVDGNGLLAVYANCVKSRNQRGTPPS